TGRGAGGNDPPVVDLNGAAAGTGNALSYTENQAATAIATNTAFVTDVDSADFNGGSLTVSFGATGHAEDQLTILTDATVTVAGGTVSVGGNAIGTVSGGVNGAARADTFQHPSVTAAARSHVSGNMR